MNVFQVHLPALRERREDIVPLAEHFLRRFDPSTLPLLPATVQFLVTQPWTGNVRELRNALEHSVIMARGGPLLPEHFQPLSGMHAPTNPRGRLVAAVLQWLAERLESSPQPPTDLYGELLRGVEQPLLEELMRRLQGNRLLASQWLGLNRTTVRKKLIEYGLENISRPSQKSPDKQMDMQGRITNQDRPDPADRGALGSES